MTTKDNHILIIGAGLAGALLAVALGRRGHRVTLYERRPDPRAAGFIGGRSINLALSCRGLTALRRYDLDAPVLADAIPMPGRMMHAPDGALTFQPYSDRSDEAINSVSRSNLNITLLEAADALDNVTIHFSHRCTDANLDNPNAPTVTLTNEQTGKTQTTTADIILGCDGAFSAVREAMTKRERFDYSQSWLAHGYKELTIPPAAECGVDPDKHDGFAMDPNALHIWPRGGSMMIALPNADRSFTCTLFWPFEGKDSFEAVATEADILPTLQRRYPDALPLMPTAKQDYINNPIGSLVTIRCAPWHTGKVLLLGDAAHAIVPFYGQGINAGFEDVRILDEMLDDANDDWHAVIPAFSASRKPHADAIADLAIVNFLEMRDRVADPAFLLRKRVEHTIHAIDPQKYQPTYNLVSFSNMPYADAREVGNRIVKLAQQIADAIGLDPARDMTNEAFKARVLELLPKLAP